MIVQSTEDSRQLARYIRDTLNGSDAEISHYYDSTGEHHIPLVKVNDSPDANLTSFSTLGLYNFPVSDDGTEQSCRYEILMAGNSNYEYLENILSTISFYVIKDKYKINPGTIFHGIAKLYDSETKIEAFLFCPPYSWGENFCRKKVVDGYNVFFLQAIPLTTYDLTRIEEIGWNNLLEKDFNIRQVDIFDFNRKW